MATTTASPNDRSSRGESHPHLVGTLIGACAGIAIAYAVSKEEEQHEAEKHRHDHKNASSSSPRHTKGITTSPTTRRSRRTTSNASEGSRSSRSSRRSVEQRPIVTEPASPSATRSSARHGSGPPLALPTPPPPKTHSHNHHRADSISTATRSTARPLTAANLSRVPAHERDASNERGIVDDLDTVSPSDSISQASSKASRLRHERARRRRDDKDDRRRGRGSRR